MTDFKAIIFDMDGVLVNSEPLWKIAETEILTSLGVPVTEEQIHNTSAMSVKGVCEFWYKIHPWANKSFDEVEKLIVDRVIELIKTHDTNMPDAYETVKYFKDLSFKIGLATNSSHNIIDVVLTKVGIKQYFDFIASVQDVESGKPEPDVYLFAAKNLNVKPENCLVIEDSVVGVQSAKTAGMTVVAMPDKRDWDKPEYEIADFKIKSLKGFPVAILS
ncbi:MAG: HAD family hydrolase [Marinilabiliales bacterium]|nr:MAG: HAD family hydrolase [Marinilabiliales bacterium]